MKNKLTIILVITFLVILLFGFTAYAYTSYQTISSTQDGAWGPDNYASGGVLVEGSNYNTSTNTLWVAGQTKGYKIFGHTFGNIAIITNAINNCS